MKLFFNRMVVLVATALAPQFATKALADDWLDISSKLDQIVGKQVSANNTPPPALADFLPDLGGSHAYTTGPIIGNGQIGVTSGGAPHTYYLSISDNRFWTGRVTYNRAAFGDSGAGYPVNLAFMKITKASGSDVDAPCSTATFPKEGYITSDFLIAGKPVHLKTYLSDDLGVNVLVTEISTPGNSPVPVRVTDSVITGDKLFRGKPIISTMTGSAGYSGTSYIYVNKQTDIDSAAWICRASVATKILGAAISEIGNGTNSSYLTFMLPANNSVVKIVSKIESVKDLPSPQSIVTNYINTFDAIAADNLAQRHVSWWKEFWLKSYVNWNDVAMHRYWYGSLYVMGCAYRQGTQASGEWGPWTMNNLPSMFGDLHTNYDMQAPFWGVFSSNHPEILGGYSKTIYTYGTTVARARVADANSGNRNWNTSWLSDVAGHMPPNCRGSEYGIGIGTYGNATGANDYSSSSNGIFSLVPMVYYWKFTQNTQYLNDTLYPLMLDQANFFEDYIGAKSGDYYNVYGACAEGASNLNTTWDLGALKYFFTEMKRASVALNLDAARRAKWQGIVDSLHPFYTDIVNGMSVYRNGQNDCGPYTHHSGEISWAAWGLADENFAQRDVVINTYTYNNGWPIPDNNSYGNLTVSVARVGINPDTLIHKYILSVTPRANFTLFQWGGGTETSGIIEAINDMMLMSNNGVIRIYPNMSANYNTEFRRLRAEGAFLVSAAKSFAGKVTGVQIFSEAGKICRVKDPWGNGMQITDLGTSDPVSISKSNGVYSFNTTAGHTYSLVDATQTDFQWVSDMPLTVVANGWGTVHMDSSIYGNNLTLRGKSYAKGLGVHAISSILVPLDKKYARFTAQVGVDDEINGNGSVVFQVWGDGQKLFESPLLHGGEVPVPVDVSVANMTQLTLSVSDGQDGYGNDHADWAYAKVATATNATKNRKLSAESFTASLQGNVLVIVRSSGDPAELRLLSLDGRTVFHSTISGMRTGVSVGAIPKGIYLLEAHGDAGVFKQKLIKN